MSTTMTSARTIARERIHIPDNVRVLDQDHVQALAGSIKLKGMLVPVVVRERDNDFELVAGFHRMAAATSIDLAEVPLRPARSRARARRPRGREHRPQAAQPLRGGQGGPGDAR